MTKVAVIDDHAVVRIGIKYVIGLKKDELEFVGEHPCGEGAVEFVCKAAPDVLLLDIMMPDKDGLTVLKEILAARPNTKVIMLTTSDADNDVYTALTLGARGYLLKDRDSGDICKAIGAVSTGRKFVPEVVMELYRRRQMTPDLTQREMDVLALVADGHSNEDIAKKLDISYNAVKFHVKNILMKLDVRDRVNLANEARKRGFVKW